MPRVLMMTDFTESYANKLLRGILRYSHEHTPWVVNRLSPSARDSIGLRGIANYAVNWHADAIIGQFKKDDDLSIFEEYGIIVVAQDYEQRFRNVSNITADYQAEGRIGARYFIDLGAENFAFCGFPGMVWSDERCDGFVSCVRSSSPDFKVFVKNIPSISGIWGREMDDLEDWLSILPKPVAIMTCDDRLAFDIIQICQQSRYSNMHIPNDIILMGVDNDELFCQLCYPSLSSLDQKVERAGYDAASAIDRRLHLPPAERFANYSDITVGLGIISSRESTEVFLYNNQYVKKACSFIHANCYDSIRVDDVVNDLPISRRLLEKVFRQETGVSIYQYIIKVRIEKIKELANAGWSLRDIVQKMNSDEASLSRTFKSVEGMPLSRYLESLASL